MKNIGSSEKICGWLKLSRLPFHTVGVLPFTLGTLLAWKFERAFSPAVFILGITAVVFIMLSTHYSGEYFDAEEDRISKSIFKSRFAGGTGVMQEAIIPPSFVLGASIASLVVAAAIGITLQFGLKTGPYTLLLGAPGLLMGFFYSSRPVRLASRGFGELSIIFCYGWLPVASAFYIQAGYIKPIIHLIGIPIGLTIFNVILLNEFPDYTGDKSAGKKNMLVRIGKKRGAYVYAAASALSWAGMFLAVEAGIPGKCMYFYIPVMILSLIITASVLRGKYKSYDTLEPLCGLNILVNIGTTASIIFAFI